MTLTGSLWSIVVGVDAQLAWIEKNWSRNDRGGSEPSVLEWQAGGDNGKGSGRRWNFWTDQVIAGGGVGCVHLVKASISPTQEAKEKVSR